VRLEVAAGLARDGLRVIPIYADGAKPPASSDLPAPLCALAQRQGLAMSHESWGSDFGRLLKALEAVLAGNR
jgi:hypothetical protein